MELFFGKHARGRMALRDISEAMAVEAVSNADRSVTQRDRLVAHFASVRGRPITVVVDYDRDPPFVVTIMDDWSAR